MAHPPGMGSRVVHCVYLCSSCFLSVSLVVSSGSIFFFYPGVTHPRRCFVSRCHLRLFDSTGLFLPLGKREPIFFIHSIRIIPMRAWLYCSKIWRRKLRDHDRPCFLPVYIFFLRLAYNFSRDS